MGRCENCNLLSLDGKQDMIKTKIWKKNDLKGKCIWIHPCTEVGQRYEWETIT